MTYGLASRGTSTESFLMWLTIAYQHAVNGIPPDLARLLCKRRLKGLTTSTFQEIWRWAIVCFCRGFRMCKGDHDRSRTAARVAAKHRYAGTRNVPIDWWRCECHQLPVLKVIATMFSRVHRKVTVGQATISMFCTFRLVSQQWKFMFEQLTHGPEWRGQTSQSASLETSARSEMSPRLFFCRRITLPNSCH